MKVYASIALLSASSGLTSAFAPAAPAKTVVPTTSSSRVGRGSTNLFASPKQRQQFDFPSSSDVGVDADLDLDLGAILPIAAASTLAATAIPFPAEAVTASPDPIPSALAAYAHYLSLFAIVGLITYERVTVEAGMSKEKEMSLGLADIGVGLSGVVVIVSGYFRATQYGKGWEFYSHEPVFWLKMIFLCIFGAATLFPTATFIQRTVAIQTGKELEPMSEKLASRLQQVLNAELVMMASIPLAASLMARGVLYTEAIPFNIIGPALCAVTAGGLGFKYVKEALTWSEEEA